MGGTGGIDKRARISILRQAMPVIMLAVMLLILSLFNKAFLSINTLKSILLQASAIGVLSLGAMVAIISGGTDFTIGYGVAAIAMVGAFGYTMPGAGRESVLLYFLFSLGGGLLLGLMNGFIIAKLHVLPFITTLATMSICQGVTLAINNGATVYFKSPVLITLGQKYLGGVVPYSFFGLAAMAVLAHILMTRTRFGMYTYAIGGNQDSARYMGINVARSKLLVYIFVGMCTAVGSILTASKIAMATPGMSGSLLMDSISATVIGGTSMSGGKGKVVNTLIGVLVIIVINMALTYMNVQTEMQKVFQGGIILLAVVLDAYFGKLESEVH